VDPVLFPSREDATGVRFAAEGGRAVASRVEAWAMRPPWLTDARGYRVDLPRSRGGALPAGEQPEHWHGTNQAVA